MLLLNLMPAFAGAKHSTQTYVLYTIISKKIDKPLA